MIPQRWIEGYLRFLLKYRGSVTIVVALITLFFAFQLRLMRLHTDFFDFYPKYRTFADAWHECRGEGGNAVSCLAKSVINPGPNPYIQIYRDFRRMFGSANILSVILEVKQGDVYNPATLQKLDAITKYVINSKGVVPYQILSIAHPRITSVTAREGGVEIRPVFYPSIPQTQADADRVKFAVYQNKGIRGIFASLDDTALVVHAGFWEEALDFRELYKRMQDLKAEQEDANHTIYITGFPWLYTSVLQYTNQLILVFVATTIALSFLLYSYFRTWTGIWVPIFSGLLSSVWGLGLAAFLGFNLDPLVLVVPIFLTARALSHSVQSMDRYHEEYHRLHDKEQAIVVSYSHLFAPAIASIVTDGIGLLIVAVAPIPLIQKVAIFASFWVVSIFISVVTLHPIILSYINPPPQLTPQAQRQRGPGLGLATVIVVVGLAAAYGLHRAEVLGGWTAFLVTTPLLAWYWLAYAEEIYPTVTRWVIIGSEGYRRWIVVTITLALFFVAPIWGWTLKVGDMTPGAALLFPDHPYNVAFHKLNHKFLGASQLIVIADTKKPDGMKNIAPLITMEEFADHMRGAEGASGSVTVIDIVKQLTRLYRDGDPKWSLVPEKPKEIGQLFYVFTNSAAAGDLDRFMDPTGRYGTVLTLFRGYSHDVVMNSIAMGKRFAEQLHSDDVEFKFAGGLFGILAAVNEAVENSYWTNLILIFCIVYFCLYLTYGSWYCSAILMIPVILSQLVAEALMVLWNIDLNVNSLPIAAAGAGVGVDYGIYHFSRMIDTFDEIGKLDEAIDYATATTGKAIIFTASTMLAGTGFFWFADLKFQAEMGMLLALLMGFNTFGGLVVVPALIKVLRPRFLLDRKPVGSAASPTQTALAS
ncbi:MAG: MMPL family transporter [Deltaproteobacteria bacterium]|nr:MMPL family transporter [Deltaproteobacteria bacterium]